jgi:protein SCO1/2/putative membrane protein
MEGKVWACSFFFASCPGNCTQMNLAIARLQKELADELPGIEVPFLSITVDPENDPPERLANYAKTFEADPKKWKFLTGPFASAEQLGKVFKVMVVPRDHSSRVVLVGSDGQVHGAYAATDPTQMVLLKKKILELAKAAPTTGPTAAPSESSAPDTAAGKTAEATPAT